MRRTVMLLGVLMVMLVAAAGVAVAVTKTCGDNLPCTGTDNDDILYERTGSVKDRILGKDGRDRIQAVTFNADRDRLEGGRQGDRLVTADGDGRDSAQGGAGRDTCIVNRRDARSSCERLNIATTTAEMNNIKAEVASWTDGS